MDLQLGWQGDKEVKRALESVTKDFTDLRPAWDRFYRPRFHSGMQETFSTAQRGTWRPLKAAYIRWKVKHGGGKLMVLSGQLRASLEGDTGESVYQPLPRSLTIGSSRFPTNTPRGRMVIHAGNGYPLRRELDRAAEEFAEDMGRTWSRGI